MIKRKILLLIFTLLSIEAFSQSNYYDYSENDRDNVFFEDFLNYTNKYSLKAKNDGISIGEYQYGYFELKSNSSEFIGRLDINKEINQMRDFEIEASIMFVSGEDNNANGISWGVSTDYKNKYTYGFSGNGSFMLHKRNNGAGTDLQKWTVSNTIYKNDYNELTIRKVNNIYYFFINKSLVHTCPFESFSGGLLNIFSNINSSIKINSIRISYLDPPSDIISNYNDYSENDRENIFFEDFSSYTNKYSLKVNNDGVSMGEYQYGYFELKSNSSNSIGILNVNKEIDQMRDFEIEASIMFVSGEDNNANGISWGGSEETKNKYMFSFTGNGNFGIFNKINNSWINIKEWTVSNTIYKNDYNELTIRKVNNSYYFFINKSLVHTCPFNVFYGSVLNIFSNSNSSIKINSIRISYLNTPSDNISNLSQDNHDELSNNFSNNLPPILSIQDITFSKNELWANETAKLSITLKNIGAGNASGVYVNLSTDLPGLQFVSKTIFPEISKSDGTQTVTIDIKGGLDLPTADAILKIEIVEPNFKIKIQGKQVKFPTKEFLKPELLLAKFTVLENLSSNPNNQIDVNEQVDVKLAVQNIGQGNAENVNVAVTNNQSGVMLLGVVDNAGNLVRKNPSFNGIQSGKYESITYRYFINSEFTSNQLEFSIISNEKIGKYGFNQSKTVEINKVLKEDGFIRTVSTNNETKNEGKVIIEDVPDFVSDVDENIPVNSIVNDKTFAVVIGNETYTKEIKVKYALNDARIFKQYLQKTLGLPANNINYIENATFGQILDGLKWINDVAKAYNGQAKIIFYYAGHGMPDEQTKSAYLLPVDGNSQNPATAVKLEEIYTKLTEFPSASVTVFLDACFSGSTRENNETMLAQGRGVKIKPKNDLLTGNIVVFSAAIGDETAFPYTEKQHGMFTYYMLKKIQETKGNTTLNDLSSFIITNVTQQSVVVNKKSQTPQVNTSSKVQNIWQTFKLK